MEGQLDPEKFRNWFFNLIRKAVILVPRNDFCLDVKISSVSTAITLTIQTKNLPIDVDLVPSLLVKADHVNNFLLVPRPFEELTAWNLHLPWDERKILDGNKMAKSAIRLFKVSFLKQVVVLIRWAQILLVEVA